MRSKLWVRIVLLAGFLPPLATSCSSDLTEAITAGAIDLFTASLTETLTQAAAGTLDCPVTPGT